MSDIFGKHVLTLKEFNSGQIEGILNLAQKLKDKHSSVYGKPLLLGKTIGMIFEKPSVRTRLSFEAGMVQLGGQAIYLDGATVGVGKRESAADVARVFSRYVDAVVYRSNSHKDIEEFAKYSSVPIINALSDASHPCQALADILTIKEHLNDFSALTLVYIGDGNNVCESLMQVATIVGLKMIVSCPKGYEPKIENPDIVIEYDPKKAVKHADVVYTDVWTSMGQEAESKQRLIDFKDYQINTNLLSFATETPMVMHCLPAHRGEEITDEVMESISSVVFDQAENRLHAQKALLIKLLNKEF